MKSNPFCVFFEWSIKKKAASSLEDQVKRSRSLKSEQIKLRLAFTNILFYGRTSITNQETENDTIKCLRKLGYLGSELKRNIPIF